MNFNSVIITGNEGIFWLNKIKELETNVEVVLITAYGDMDLTIRSLKGASYFLVKPWKNENLIQSISEILTKRNHLKLKNGHHE